MAFINEYPYTDFNEFNLDWIIKTVKDLTKEWAETKEEWISVEAAWISYKNYIDNYFANLNVQEEINNKIDQLVSDGTINQIVIDAFSDEFGDIVPPIITQWLNDNITQETGYVIDDTLTVSSAAADAAAVGTYLRSMEGPTANLFDPLKIEIGKNAAGTSGFPKRAISGAMFSNIRSIAVKAYTLPANLEYSIEIYSSEDMSTRTGSYPNHWITDDTEYNTATVQSTYKYFRLLFGSVNNANLTASDFDGLEIMVNTGGRVLNYRSFVSAEDNVVRLEPVTLRVMEYNIGHYYYGLGSDFTETGLPADLYDEKVANMKRFFAKYRPDVLGLCEYWQWLDNAQTHDADSVLFDPIYPYKNQTTQWNALKSDYELNTYRQINSAGSGQKLIVNEICVNGKWIPLVLVHFGLNAANRITEMNQVITLMNDFDSAIVMGDFNPADATERDSLFAIATSAGYTLANGGYFGWYNTWNYSSPSIAIDNIMFKGSNIKLKNFEVLYSEVQALCSDHVPIIADLLIY